VFVEPEPVELVTAQFLRAAAELSFDLIAYCFMPDHVHVVAEGKSEDADLKRFVSRAKQLSGYHYGQRFGKRLWQRYSYERVLRDDESTRDVVRYVLENPVRAGLVDAIEKYPFIGSSVYSREDLIDFAYAWSG
jgi:putative transposase